MNWWEEMLPIPKGMLFTISTGAYSDYDVKGVFRAKADIDVVSLREQWKNNILSKDEDCYQKDEFFKWIIDLGIIEPVPSMEWHLCDYDDLDEMYCTNLEEEEE